MRILEKIFRNSPSVLKEVSNKDKIINYSIMLIGNINQNIDLILIRLENDKEKKIIPEFEREIRDLSESWEKLVEVIKTILNKYCDDTKIKLRITDEIKKNSFTISKISILVIKDLNKKKEVLTILLESLSDLKRN